MQSLGPCLAPLDTVEVTRILEATTLVLDNTDKNRFSLHSQNLEKTLATKR